MAKKPKKYSGVESYFCDSSFLIAYFADKDQYHAQALRIKDQLIQKPLKLISSWQVISETSTLLLYHYGYTTAFAFLKSLAAFELITPKEEHFQKATKLFEKYNQKLKVSFNDLLVLILSQEQGNIPILSFDADFKKLKANVFLLH